MQKLRRMMVRITDRQHDFLTREAEKSGISVTEALRRILDQIIEVGAPSKERKS